MSTASMIRRPPERSTVSVANLQRFGLICVTTGTLLMSLKSPWYIASGNPDPHAIPDLFSDLNPKRHTANRKKVAFLYSMTNLVQMEPFVDECTALLVAKFADFAKQGESVDMGHWLQCYAFDVIGQVTASYIILD